MTRVEEEELAHYGKMGMHWGVTRAQATPTQIRKARVNVKKEKAAYKSQAQVVKAMAKGSEARAKGEKELATMNIARLKNPDRVISARLTRGEKVASIIAIQEGGLGLILGTSLRSRRIEYKQSQGSYDKKDVSFDKI